MIADLLHKWQRPGLVPHSGKFLSELPGVLEFIRSFLGIMSARQTLSLLGEELFGATFDTAAR